MLNKLLATLRDGRLHIRALPWLVAFVFLETIFVWLTIFVMVDPQNSFDVSVTNFIHQFSNPVLDKIMIVISLPGEFPISGLVLIFFGAWLYRRYQNKGLLLATTLTGFTLVSEAFKVWVSRPRPEIFLTEGYRLPSDFSFPSGHARFYILVLGLALLIALSEFKLRKERNRLVIAVLLAILSVGISRVYLGVHWATDVLGGYLLGLGLLEVLVIVYYLTSARKFW